MKAIHHIDGNPGNNLLHNVRPFDTCSCGDDDCSDQPTERMREIANFLENHGRDEGGFDDKTRRWFAGSADFLRSLIGEAGYCGIPRPPVIPALPSDNTVLSQ